MGTPRVVDEWTYRKDLSRGQKTYRRHREEYLAKARARYATPEYKAGQHARNSRFYQNHREEQIARVKKYYQENNDIRKTKWETLRVMALNELGGKCADCGERDMIVLTIQHKNGGGGKDRRKRGQYTMYREIVAGINSEDLEVLCMNCQFRHARKHNFFH